MEGEEEGGRERKGKGRARVKERRTGRGRREETNTRGVKDACKQAGIQMHA